MLFLLFLLILQSIFPLRLEIILLVMISLPILLLTSSRVLFFRLYIVIRIVFQKQFKQIFPMCPFFQGIFLQRFPLYLYDLVIIGFR